MKAELAEIARAEKATKAKLDEDLVELVRAHPVLFDKSHPD